MRPQRLRHSASASGTVSPSCRQTLLNSSLRRTLRRAWAPSRCRSNARLAAPEIAHILDDCGSTALAFSATQAQLAEAASHLAAPTALLSLGPSTRYPDLIAGGYGDAVHEDRADEQDDAFILYTSGTTGKPKGVLLDHHRAVWAAMAQIVSLGLRDGDRYLHLAPMYHSGGMTFMNATTLLGGTHIVTPKFDPTVLELIERYRATWLFAVPTMYKQILNSYERSGANLTSWRVGIFGAAPMPAAAIERLLDAFPRVAFFQQCGQTEAGPTGIYSTMEQVRSRPMSSGHLAQPFVEARVVDERGNDTPPGQVGGLVFAARRSPRATGTSLGPARTSFATAGCTPAI